MDHKVALNLLSISMYKSMIRNHILPFQNIPKFMIRYLAFEVVIKFNYFPGKGGLSPYYIPQTIMGQQPLWTIRYIALFHLGNSSKKIITTIQNIYFLLTVDSIYLQSLDKIHGVN